MLAVPAAFVVISLEVLAEEGPPQLPAALPFIVTGAKVDRLIPLYAIGVFTSFTLSQGGMAKHHITHKEEGWRVGLFINGMGALLSLVVDRAAGVTMEEFVAKRIFEPLGMKDTTFWPSEAQIARLAGAYGPEAAAEITSALGADIG